MTTDFKLLNSGAAWSFGVTDDGVLRFEVRDGDTYALDSGLYTPLERSEATCPQSIQNGDPLHIGFSFSLEPGAANTASFLTVGELKAAGAASGRPAIVDIDLQGEKLAVFVRYSGSDGSIRTQQLFVDTVDIERGRFYHIELSGVIDPNGNAKLVVLRDGIAIAAYSGPLGYSDATASVWNEGILRAANATETTVALFKDLTFETGAGTQVADPTDYVPAPILKLVSVQHAGAGYVAMVTGTGLPGQTVAITEGKSVLCSLIVGIDGTFSGAAPISVAGIHTLSAAISSIPDRTAITSAPIVIEIGDAAGWSADSPPVYIVDMPAGSFWVQNAGNDWSLSAPDAQTLRFEVRDGDTFSYDARGYAERSEIADQRHVVTGTSMEIAYDLMIESGAPNTARWLVLGQIHLEDAPGLGRLSPPVEFTLIGEKLTIVVHYTDATGSAVSKTVFTDPYDIVRGEYQHIDIKAVFDPNGDGRLVVVRDGVTLADYAGPLGYVGQGATYWKEGVYRHASATETFAANYRNLEISTGSVVSFPPQSDFIDGPQLAVTSVGAPDASGMRSVTIIGSTKPNSLVAIYEGMTKLGEAMSDYAGGFSLTLSLSHAPEHLLLGVATDSSGRSGIFSQPMSIEIGTSAEIFAKLDSLAAQVHVGAIVLTDSNVFLAESLQQVSRVVTRDGAALSKIVGEFSFKVSIAVTGSAYDRQDTLLNGSGVVTEVIRYSGGKVVSDQVFGADGSSTVQTPNTFGGVDIAHVSAAGRIVDSSRYNDAGSLLTQTDFYADGSRATHQYSPTSGIETGYTLYAADKSRITVTLGILNQSYASQAVHYDKTGRIIQQERFDVDGHKVWAQTWMADGSRVLTTFDAQAGAILTSTSYFADGSRSVTTYAQDVAKTKVYDVHNVLTASSSARDGLLVASESWSSDGGHTVFVVNATTGAVEGYKTVYPDGHSEAGTYVSGGYQLASLKTYDSSGRLEELDTFAGGQLVRTDAYAVDGSRQITTFGITGKDYDKQTITISASDAVVSVVRWSQGTMVLLHEFNADLTQTVTRVQDNGDFSVWHISEQGLLTSLDTYDRVGHHLTSEVRLADGAREVHHYDALSGLEVRETDYAADGSRMEVQYDIQGKTYAEQSMHFDKAGQLTALERYYGDAAHTLQMSQKVHADGSSEVYAYDTAGRETSTALTATDGSRTLVTFAYDAAGSTPVTVVEDHRNASNVRLFLDTTDQSGVHTIRAYQSGLTLSSHEGVRDVFTSQGGDTFAFTGRSGEDAIVNFHLYGTAKDLISIDQNVAADFAHLTIVASGANTLISLSDTDSITLYNVRASELTSGHFLFV